MMKMIIFKIFMIYLAVAEGFRLKRSELDEPKGTASEEDTENNGKSADDELFNDDMLNKSQDQAEHEALDLIPDEISSGTPKDDPEVTSPPSPSPYTYSVTSNIISDLPYTTPSPQYGAPTHSSLYSQSPSQFFGSPTASFYHKLSPYHKQTFTPATNLHVKSLPPRNPMQH